MVAFHRKLRAGLDKDEALRQASDLVRRNPRTAHPYYWAPFFLIGDPGNPTLGVARSRVGRGECAGAPPGRLPPVGRRDRGSTRVEGDAPPLNTQIWPQIASGCERGRTRAAPPLAENPS